MKKLLYILLLSAALPLILLQSLNAQTISGNVTLSATATDVTATAGDTECGIKDIQFFNGASPLGSPITSPNSGTNYNLSLDTKTLPNGNYVITAKATDKAGSGTSPTTVCDGTKPNISTSNAINITVDNRLPDASAPSISITIIVVVTP